MKNKRSLLFKLGAVLILVAIAVVMFIIGRGHTVYMDTSKIAYDGKTLEAPYKVVVLVDGEQVAKLYEKERGMATCIGQTFQMQLDITQEKGGDTHSVKATLPLPYNMDGIIINIPALLAGAPEEVYLSEFIPTAEEEVEEEEIQTDEFSIGDF